MYGRKLYILFSFILILFFLIGCSSKFYNNSSRIVDGSLDISQHDFEKDIIRLDGQWEFYWNQILSPQGLKELNTRQIEYIDVPSSWNKHTDAHKKLSGDGYATYRLSLKTDEIKRLGIKMPRIFTSYNLWVNGEIIANAGIIGKDRQTTTPQYLPQIAIFETQQGENEIIIQVSNFYHRSGGILESLIMGNESKIIELGYKSVAYELLLFGILIIMGAYHIALFFFRRKNQSPLYFGLFCIFISIRTLLVGERFFIQLFPEFSWEVAHKIQGLTFYLGVPLILAFFKSVFPKDFHSKIVKVIWSIGIIFTSLVILTPARIFTIFNPVYQIFTMIVIVYITFTFIKIILRKEEGIGLTVIGASALILASINDIIFLSIWMNDNGSPLVRSIFRTGNLSSVGQMIFVFTNSLVLAQRFSNALEHEEVMTAQLKEINLNLDKLVVKRTEDLEKSRKQIENQKIELEKVNLTLQQLSLKDPLTGLWNRRRYDAVIFEEWNRGLRHNRPISLVMIDLDYFKLYNDYYGHDAGDRCLIQIAQIIKDSFRRASDLVARYGGEEFIVIIPELEKNQVINMANSLKKTIEDSNIPHANSSVGPWVTASIGVTSIVPNMDCSPRELFLTVDKALYQAKASGRNQVVFLSLTDINSSPVS